MNLLKLSFLTRFIVSFSYAAITEYSTVTESYNYGNQSHIHTIVKNITSTSDNESGGSSLEKIELTAQPLCCITIFFLVISILFTCYALEGQEANWKEISAFVGIFLGVLALEIVIVLVWVFLAGGKIIVDATTFITSFSSTFLTAAIAFAGWEYTRNKKRGKS